MNRREFVLAACGGAAVLATEGKAFDKTLESRRKLRRVQILHRDEDGVGFWVDIEMKNVRKGNIFRMFGSDGEVVDPKGNKIWVATEDAHQACSGAPNETVWGVESKPPPLPIIMNPGKMWKNHYPFGIGSQSMTTPVEGVFDWKVR